MKTILVPTDFSANAEHALQYAIDLNKNIHAKILLFHSCLTPMYATDIPVMVPSKEEIKREALDSLQEIKKKFSKLYPEQHFDLEVSSGIAEDEIIDEEKKTRADLVIMGTQGARGLREIFIGSNAASVIEKSLSPVIAVPSEARMLGLHKIVFATNFAENDFENVFELIEFARLFEAEVILLHITTGDKDKTREFAEIEGFEQSIAKQSEYPKISFKLLESIDIFEGLNNYLDEIKADLIAVSMRERSAFQKLFSRSLTKKMAYHSHIPLMAFHTEF